MLHDFTPRLSLIQSNRSGQSATAAIPGPRRNPGITRVDALKDRMDRSCDPEAWHYFTKLNSNSMKLTITLFSCFTFTKCEASPLLISLFQKNKTVLSGRLQFKHEMTAQFGPFVIAQLCSAPLVRKSCGWFSSRPDGKDEGGKGHFSSDS